MKQATQPTSNRLVPSIDFYRSQTLFDKMKRRKTVKHLSHSAHTSESYYEYMNCNDATEAHATISKLLARRQWKQNETNCCHVSGLYVETYQTLKT